MFNEAEALVVSEIVTAAAPVLPEVLAKPPRKRSPESGGRAPLPKHLPRKRAEVDVPDE
jgi:hypothetical protein